MAHIDRQLTALAVTETWLKAHNEDTYNLPGYVFVSCSRPSKVGGGLGFYINDCIQFKVLNEHTYITDVIERIFLELKYETNRNCIIGCIYRPPSSDINTFNDVLSRMIESDCFKQNKDIIILGDFNINILLHKVHQPASEFLNNMLSFGLLPCITKPSRVTVTSESLIDNIFTNLDPSACKSALVYQDISDHYPIIMQISKPNTMNKSKNKAKSNNRRIFSPDAIEKFKNYLLSVNWEFTTNNDNNLDINAIYDDFLHVFNHGFDICFPKSQQSTIEKLHVRSG